MTNLFYLLIISALLQSSVSSATRGNPNYSSSSSSLSSSSTLKGFNVVTDFGAKNDGKIDSTKAFINAWNAACASEVPSQIYVPNGDYLLTHVIFQGYCKSSILFRIDGILHANNVYSDHWIVFHNVDGLHIKGGVLDAKGKSFWSCKLGLGGHRCHGGAKSLSIEHSKNVIVDGLTSRNSQLFHIAINACQNVNMGGLTVTADADSPNTDGIHVEKSMGITIMHSEFMTGDDCISLGPNNQNIWIENVFCGPGHGISIGSLGRENDEGVLVQNVTVKTVTLTGTDNGLRIKTFASPINGIVKDIYFIGAIMTNVRNPIIIDQYYCPHGNCPTSKGSNIQISNVVYKNIRGISSSKEIITFRCSSNKSCYDLKLEDINLSYQLGGPPKCQSNYAYMKVVGFMQPSKCLFF